MMDCLIAGMIMTRYIYRLEPPGPSPPPPSRPHSPLPPAGNQRASAAAGPEQRPAIVLVMTAWLRRRPTATALLALAAVAWVLDGGHAAASTRAPQPAASSSWTVYHGDAAGLGVAAPVASVNTTTRAWTSPALDGQIYGEPLVSAGRVYVATENDTVYALSAATGAVAWSAHLGRPVPSGSLPCGNITPTVGITGTPVIDQSRGEIFVVADELVNGKPAHVLAGLATASGKVEVTTDVDPAGADTAALLQRTGLTLDDGQVVFGMGGNFGDCAAYQGRVIAVQETGGTPKTFTVDAAAGSRKGRSGWAERPPWSTKRRHLGQHGHGSVYSDSQPTTTAIRYSNSHVPQASAVLRPDYLGHEQLAGP